MVVWASNIGIRRRGDFNGVQIRVMLEMRHDATGFERVGHGFHPLIQINENQDIITAAAMNVVSLQWTMRHRSVDQSLFNTPELIATSLSYQLIAL